MFEFWLGGLALVLAFLVTFFLTKVWIKVANKAGLVGKDVNKWDKPEIAEAGGIAVILGFAFALLFYIFSKTFLLRTETHLLLVFALLATILLAGFLGFTDDILGWKLGLRGWQKVLLTVPIALPLVVINAGHSTMSLPLLGPVDFGLLYPLLIVPVAIIGAANGFNMLAGFNGLEAGMGIIILSTLGLISWSGAIWISLICFSMVSALFTFLIFNHCPAKVFPGDSLTYSVGALIAAVAILGNMEKVALILFTPYFIELFLKARSRFRAECFGLPQPDGTLTPRYEKNYSLTHVVLRYLPKLIGRNLREGEAVLVLITFNLIFALIAVLMVL
jgi:UDP-N-acetylglucosamine--dolichyl-phosphate N-acetylglucosaminephosphotransferase